MSRERFDRTLPWALFIVVGATLLLGISWDASFEATPANSDLVSQGDDRIRELKVEIADRGEDEQCWGTGATTGCPGSGDNGFHREGSARGFFATAAPTTLNDAASTALAAGHDGRVWVDDDGLDGSAATYDDTVLHAWDGTAFDPVRALAIITFNSATIDDDQLFDLGTIDAAPATLAMTGGAGAGGIPMVTVPASGTWDIRVFGHVTVSPNAALSVVDLSLIVRLQEQVAAGAFVSVGWCSAYIDNAMSPDDGDPILTCTLNYVRRAATVATAYSYRYRISATTNAETEDVLADSTFVTTDGEGPNVGYLTAEMVRR